MTLEFISEYGMFLAKIVTVVVAILIIMASAIAAGHKSKKEAKGHIEVAHINEQIKNMTAAIRHEVLAPEQLKQEQKEEKAQHKQEKAERKKQAKAIKTSDADADAESESSSEKKRVFVLDFHGDIKASATDNLREEITAVLDLATENDEVVVKLESGGGMVHSYGLASSQLDRIKKKNVPLTICVDKVAASGGYMMACVADKILAAPFAMLGSIGVLAQIPNFNRLLKKHDIDYEMLTAGEYKRTLTVFGENTDKDREKFQEDIEDIHHLFKDFVSEHRPSIDINQVATGEVWFGRRALDKNLVDELVTSDEYITGQVKDADIFEVSYVHKKTLSDRLSGITQKTVDNLVIHWLSKIQQSRFFS